MASSSFALTGLLPPSGFPFLTLFPTVMITAFVAGLWPGVMVALLSIWAAWCHFIEPPGDVGMTSGDLIALAFFSLILLIDCVVIHLMTAAAGGLKVLIVDDNVDAADMLGMFVESLGHQVVIETNPALASIAAWICNRTLRAGLRGRAPAES